MEEFYIYINGNIQQYNLEQLKGIGIKPDDFICRVGSEDWTKAGNFEELNDFFYPTTTSETLQAPILKTNNEPVITDDTPPVPYTPSAQPKPSKVLIIVGILSILLLIGIIWFSLKPKSEVKPPINPPTSDSTVSSSIINEQKLEDCSKFSELISEGKNLMGESDLQKKEEALLYFEKAKDLINAGCDATENTNTINQQANDYNQQADDLENSYKQLSADIKNDPAGTTILNRAKYFRKASQILTTPQK